MSLGKNHITLGMAGHIDHGKTALVKKITGYDLDRLKEEKKRGITIDLGFAALTLPSGNTVSIVDVPGHEKFVKTMVAGVSGINCALLVIALDEGIMPQTLEHINILTILGVKEGLVALTKKDLVSEEVARSREKEIREYLKETGLKDYPLFSVSSVTGEGIDKLLDYLDVLAFKDRDLLEQGPFRMPVDRVFSMAGYGTVVTGTIASGKAEKGMAVELLPERISSKIRGLQVREEAVIEAFKGDRCAINLLNVQKEQIKRGTVVSEKGRMKATGLIDGILYMAKDQEPLKHNQPVHFHTGTATQIARVRIIGKDEIKEEDKGFVQIRLKEQVPCLRGDKFIIRSFSPVVTIGGGTVLLSETRHRKRHDEKELLEMTSLEKGDEKASIENLMTLNKNIFSMKTLSDKSNGDEEKIKEAVESLLEENKIVEISKEGLYMGEKPYREACEKIRGELQSYNEKHPFRYEMPKEELRTRLKEIKEGKEFSALLKKMEEEGMVFFEGNYVRLSDEETIEKVYERKEVKSLLGLFNKEPYQVLSTNYLVLESNIPRQNVEEALEFLKRQGELFEIDEKVFVKKEDLNKVYYLISDHLEKKNELSAAELRDILKAGRKSAIGFLEYFDSENVTLRMDNIRVMGENFRSWKEREEK